MAELEIQGTCDGRFAALRDAFAAGFLERDEVGAAVSLMVDGETVVDLWGGHREPERTPKPSTGAWPTSCRSCRPIRMARRRSSSRVPSPSPRA